MDVEADNTEGGLAICRDLLTYAYRDYFQKTGNTEILGPRLTLLPKAVGELLLHYCSLYGATFRRIYLKTFPEMCSSDKAFLQYIVTHCQKFFTSQPFYAFMVSSVFIADLVLLCFENHCYRFMNTAPVCLYAMMNRLLNINDVFDRDVWTVHLSSFCVKTYLYTQQFKTLIDSSVDKTLPESLLHHNTIERMYLRNSIHQIEDLVGLQLPSENLWVSEILLTTENGIVLDSCVERMSKHEDVCKICSTRCVIFYKIYLNKQSEAVLTF